jgi:hypothetical protein
MSKALTTLRTRIAKLQAERADLQAQDLSQSDVRHVAAVAVEALAAQWTERCDLALRRMSTGWSPRTALELLLDPAGDRSPDAVALAGLVGAGALSAALNERLPIAVLGGPSAAERAARLAAIAAELDEVEAREEQLITASEEAGTPIARRPDARCEIILALVEDAPPVPTREMTPEAEALQAEVLRDRAIAKARDAHPPAKSPYLARGEA